MLFLLLLMLFWLLPMVLLFLCMPLMLWLLSLLLLFFLAVFLATGVKVAAVVSVNVNGFCSFWLFLQLSMALLLLLLLRLSLFLMLLPLLKRLLLSSYQIHLQAKFLNFKNECLCLVAQCDLVSTSSLPKHGIRPQGGGGGELVPPIL